MNDQLLGTEGQDPQLAESAAPKPKAVAVTAPATALAPTPDVETHSRLAEPGWFYGALVASVLCLWSFYYGRAPGSSRFEVPVQYLKPDGALSVLATIKAFAAFPPPWNIGVEQLNAPAGANWNDFPLTEKLVFYVAGSLARVLGLGSAANLTLLLAQVSAAVSFGWVARQSVKRSDVAFAGALLFALCPYLMMSSLARLASVFVWHVPLLIYLVLWLGRAEAAPSPRARVLSALLLVAASFQSPYYAFIAWQLMLFAVVRGWQLGRLAVARWGLVLVAIGGGSMILAVLNTSLFPAGTGANPDASKSNLSAIVASGLRLPDLFYPLDHPIRAWSDFARKHYFNAENPASENTVAFLGIVGCAGLVTLLGVALSNGLRKRWASVPAEAWLVIYVLLFAVVGGLDYLLGAFGITSLHASHRYSIVISCVVLLWGGRAIGELKPTLVTRWSVPALLLLGGVELFGMRPRDFGAEAARTVALVNSDRDFVSALEQRLPVAASVLGLPLADFPDGAAVDGMSANEMFRPFLWAEALRFSFGGQRGRAEPKWKDGLSQAPAAHVLRMANEQRFDAIVINRRGYKDGAAALDAGLLASTSKLLTSGARDLVAFDVKPAKQGLRRRQLSFRFFPQGDDGQPYTAESGRLVDPEDCVSLVSRSSLGTFSVTLRFPIKRVISIQLTPQSVKATNSFVKLFDVLYEGTPSLFAFRINNVESGELADLPAGPHNSIMVMLDVEVE